MISVIVPVYNVEKFLPKCLDSIINQTYKDLEIIVINDGSTDNSGAICDEYAQRDKRIKVIYKENAGVSAARNDGLKCATGEYITFLDSDDYIECNMYELLISNMNKYDADVSHCGYKRVSTNGDIIKEVNGTGRLLQQNEIESIEYMLSGKCYSPSLCNKLFKAELFEGIRLCSDLSINEDVLCVFELFQKSRRLVFLDEPLYCYVIHDESTCNSSNNVLKLQDTTIAAKRMIEKCQFDKLMALLENRYISFLSQFYRSLLNNSNVINKNGIKTELKIALKEKSRISKKNRLIGMFSLYFPHLYNALFYVYDKIRTPKWDAKI